MKLIWQEQSDGNHTVYYASSSSGDDIAIRAAVGECIEKAVGLLSQNIQEDSMYFMLEWHCESSTLSIIVTDEFKQKDSPMIVKCQMSALGDRLCDLNISSPDQCQDHINQYVANVKYWSTDYFTTCGAFLKYSLIAVYYTDSRSRVELL
jgi:hypothetical protein